MRHTIRIALRALYFLIFTNSIFSAPVPFIHPVFSLPTLTHLSYGKRQDKGINLHRPSSVNTSSSTDFVLSYRCPLDHLYASNHHEKMKEACHRLVGGTHTEKEKEAGYENRQMVGTIEHHKSSRHDSPKSALVYSYSLRRLQNSMTSKLGRWGAAKLKAGNVKAANPCYENAKPEFPGSRSSENRECDGTQAPLHDPSSDLSDFDVMPDKGEELLSSWVLLHWRTADECGYTNHSRLFTEDVFEWALWILGLALVLAVGAEGLSIWNAMMEGLLKGAAWADAEDEEREDMEIGHRALCPTKPTQTSHADQHRSYYEQMKILSLASQYGHSVVGEELYIDDETDENGMEKSSW